MTDSRAWHLLEAPILPALLRLATPGVVLALFQTAVSPAPCGSAS